MGKKILLADDSITIQKVIELTFSDEDFDVVTVGNGRLAIERVQEVRPDVVLCDIIMPEKDGYEVCDFIKKTPSLAHVPVLLLTGAFEPFDQDRAARVGCDGYLAKPFEPQTLIAKVKDLLANAGARRGAGRPAPSPAAVPPVAVVAPPPAPAAAQPAPRSVPTPPHTSPGFAPPQPASVAPPAVVAPPPRPAPVPVASAASEYEAFYPTPEEIEPLTASPEFEPVFAPSDFEPVEAYTQEFEPVDPDASPASAGPDIDPNGATIESASTAEVRAWSQPEEDPPSFIPEDPLSTPVASAIPGIEPPAWAAVMPDSFEASALPDFEPVDEAPTGPHALDSETPAAWTERALEPEPETAPAPELPMAVQAVSEVLPAVEPAPGAPDVWVAPSEAALEAPVEELSSFEETFDEPALTIEPEPPAPVSEAPAGAGYAAYETYDPGAFDPGAFEPAAFEPPAPVPVEAAPVALTEPARADEAVWEPAALEPVEFEPVAEEPAAPIQQAPSGASAHQPVAAGFHEFEPAAFEAINTEAHEPETAPASVTDTAVFSASPFEPERVFEAPVNEAEPATLDELAELEPAAVEEPPAEEAGLDEALLDEPAPLLEALEDEAEASDREAWEPEAETLPGRMAAPSFDDLTTAAEPPGAGAFDDGSDAPVLEELEELTGDAQPLEALAAEVDTHRTGLTLPLSGAQVAAALAATAAAGSVAPPVEASTPAEVSASPAPASPVAFDEPEPAPPMTSASRPDEELSFEDMRAASTAPAAPLRASEAAAVTVPVDMVEQIARRVVAQLSEKVLREIAWEVVPELAEALIKKEIARIRAELDALP